MAYVFTRDYELELLELNKDMYHVYIEAHVGAGGERKIIFLRFNESSVSLSRTTTSDRLQN